MRIVEHIAEMRALLGEHRRAGARIGFVPTMGYLHEGHLSLVDEARRRTDVAVMSIFVNPLQFGPADDLARYPRDAGGDAAKAEARGVDVLFLPAVAELYPGEVPDVTVVPGALASQWEGAVRPGHFAGVLTVVAKLFNIVGADVAVFGQKDLQQLTLVRAMVRALDFPVEIVGAPTAREADGLAMSSRNSFLDSVSRQRALLLSRALRAIARDFDEGERDVERLEHAGRAVLAAEPEVRVDYLAVVEPRALTRVPCAAGGSAAMVAARVGVTRLIDNVILGAA